MSNSPMKGDLTFIKNLKKGDPVYTAEISWNPDEYKADIIIGRLLFDHFDTDSKIHSDKNEEVYYGVLASESGNIKTESHNLNYGFYQTPMKAIESLETLFSVMLKSIKQEKRMEEKRVKKAVQTFLDVTKDVDPKDVKVTVEKVDESEEKSCSEAKDD